MSLPKEDKQRSLFDVPVLVGPLFDKLPCAERFKRFTEKILPRLRDQRPELAALYCDHNGRPSIEPVLALGVTLLQFMEKAPDRVAIERLRLHLGWKYALDIEIGHEGFHPTSLVKFRKRLLEGGAERIGFDALLEGLQAEGLLKHSRKQRLDSTHVLGAVAHMGRLEVIRATIGKFLLWLERQGLADQFEAWPAFRERYLDCEIQWHRADSATLNRGTTQAGKDALELILWIREQADAIPPSESVKLLERVFSEQYDWEEPGASVEGAFEGGKATEKPPAPNLRKTPPSGAVQNPHAPDAQWAAKDLARKKQWVGYKAQIAETVAEDGLAKRKGEPTEQFITEVTTTAAIASDFEGRRQVEDNQQANGQEVASELYVDSGYVSEKTLAEAAAQGRELVGPARPPGRPSKTCYGADDFDVNIAERTAICPAGHKSRQCSSLENQQTKKIDYRFEWASLCDTCCLQQQCTKSRSGRRSLVVGEHHDHLQRRRKQMQTSAFRETMKQRNGIEGTISEWTRQGGRRTRYRGFAKTTLANYFVGAAVNANRWIRLVSWERIQATTN